VADVQKPKEPMLVTAEGERKPTAITREELFELLKPSGQNEAQMATLATMMAEAMATAVAKATADAQNAVFEKMSGETKYGEWNIANFPDRSVFNPLGDNAKTGLPRPELNGEIFWVGTPMDEREMSREEIELANELRPGIYHGGQWKVTNLAPGMNKRALLVVFPCVEPDQRSSLPSMVAMLREMVDAAKAHAAA
jgi:hypothetical protein